MGRTWLVHQEALSQQRHNALEETFSQPAMTSTRKQYYYRTLHVKKTGKNNLTVIITLISSSFFNYKYSI